MNRSMKNWRPLSGHGFKTTLSALFLSALAVLSVPAAPSTAAAEGGTIIDQIRAPFVNTSSPTPVISNVSVPGAPVGAYQKFEVSFDLQATYANPFDPDDINVEGHFIYPDGREVVVPAFYYDKYEPLNGKTTTAYNVSLYRSLNDSGWKIRFSSGTTGNYQFYITAADSQGHVGQTAAAPFTIVPSSSKGYVQVSQTNPKYFENSADNSLFYGSGTNVPYIRGADVKSPAKESYEYFLGRAKDNSNITRVWITNWRWLEWTPDPANPDTFGYAGVGYYNQMVASMVDRIYDMAEADNLKVMLVLDDNNELVVGNGYESWDAHPYSAGNGGPALNNTDYWTNPQVRELYKKKLRYVAARWGYSSSMWAINQWNDMSNPKPMHVDYMHDMRDYTHTLFDSWRPMIFGANFGRDVDSFMDYSQFGKSTATGKPGVVQESYYTANLDWFNSVLQEQQWGGLVKGNAAKMVWRYMDVESQNSWPIFKSLLDFVYDLPLNKKTWSPADLDTTVAHEGSGELFTKIIEVSGYGDINSYGVKAPENDFIVDSEEESQFLMGFASGSGFQGHVLYGYGGDKAALRNPPTFHINVPEAGQMVVKVNTVDKGPHTLFTTVNGAAGPTISWNYAAKTDLKGKSEAEQLLTIPLIQGDNSITLDITGSGFVRLANIYFLLDTSSPSGVLSINGMISGSQDDAFIYFKNQTYTELYQTVLGKQSVNVSQITSQLHGLNDGTYNVVFYDPSVGNFTGSTTAASSGGVLTFSIPQIGKDLAVKIRDASLPIQTTLDKALAGVSLNTNGAALYKDQTLQLAVNKDPVDANISSIEWTSSNPQAAAVDSSGLVTAVEIGDAVIEAAVTDSLTGDVKRAQAAISVVGGNVALLEETFDSQTSGAEPAGWVITKGNTDQTAVVTADPAASGSKWVTMSRGASGTALQAKKVLSESGLSGRMTLETSILAPTNETRILWLTNAANANIMRIAFSNDNRNVKVSDGALSGATQAINTGDTYPLNSWIPVKLEMDMSAKTYYITVNNGPRRGPYQMAPNVANNLGTMYFSLQTAKAYTMGFDNVKLSVPVRQVEQVVFDRENAVLDKGDTLQIEATVTPQDATSKALIWSSSAPEIAAVSTTGLVTAVGEGTAVIRAEVADPMFGSAYDELELTVNLRETPATGLTLNTVSAAVYENASFKLHATVAPADATYRTVNWLSADPNIATVNSEGLVTAKQAGATVVTASLEDPLSGQLYTAGASIKVIPFLGISYDFNSDAVNSIPAGWSTSDAASGNTVTVVGGVYGNKMVSLNKAVSNVQVWTNADLYGLTGKVVVESALYASGNNNKARIMLLNNTNGDTVVRFALAFDSNIKVSTDTGDSIDSGLTYKKDTWYQVKFVLDTEAGSYDLYVDNVKLGTYSLRSSLYNLGKIEFRSTSSGTYGFMVDDVKAYLLDTTAPTAVIAYSATGPTGAAVTATMTPSEPVTITNNGGASSYTFYYNGSFTFEFTDRAGNRGTAAATVANIQSKSTAKPGKPALSDDNGYDTGLQNGAYNVTMNLYYGENGRIYKLYENDVLIDTKVLTDNTPGAQSVTTAVYGKPNGTYRYVAELTNGFGTTASDARTVTVTQAAPGKPVLSNDNWDGDGAFIVNMNMWWGTNGAVYNLYENGVLIYSQPLSAHTPSAQAAAASIAGRAKGTYEYRAELVNAAGAASSDKMIVQVTK